MIKCADKTYFVCYCKEDSHHWWSTPQSYQSADRCKQEFGNDIRLAILQSILQNKLVDCAGQCMWVWEK